jgi:ketosteroid isomerase-like protein
MFNIKGEKTMIGAIIAKKKVRAGLEALNRRDIPAFLSGWADDAVWNYPGDLPVSGRFVGKQAISGWFENLMLQMPHLKFTVHSVSVSNVFDLVGNNVAAAHWEVDFTNRDGYRTPVQRCGGSHYQGGKGRRGVGFPVCHERAGRPPVGRFEACAWIGGAYMGSGL